MIIIQSLQYISVSNKIDLNKLKNVEENPKINPKNISACISWNFELKKTIVKTS